MNEEQLDRSYTAMCEALAQVGEGEAPMFLSMLCLSLISRAADTDEVLALIELARSRCGDGPIPLSLAAQAHPP